jgi:copper(I)-binding protein
MKTHRITALISTLALAATFAWSDTAGAQNASIGSLEIRDAWVRESIGPAKTAAGYLELHNGGQEAVTVTGINSESAERAQLHTTVRDGDVTRMRPLEPIAIAPGETLVLQPGGMHIMFMGVDEPLRPGMQVDLTLTLSNGRAGRLKVPVRALNANAGQGGPQHGGAGREDTHAGQHKHKN